MTPWGRTSFWDPAVAAEFGRYAQLYNLNIIGATEDIYFSVKGYDPSIQSSTLRWVELVPGYVGGRASSIILDRYGNPMGSPVQVPMDEVPLNGFRSQIPELDPGFVQHQKLLNK